MIGLVAFLEGGELPFFEKELSRPAARQEESSH